MPGPSRELSPSPPLVGVMTAGEPVRTRAIVPLTDEPAWVRRTLIALAVVVLGLFLVAPVAVVVVEALSQGVAVYWAAVSDEVALAAVKLTLLCTVVAVPLNTVFGLAAAWCLTRFRFRGRSILVSLIDLPFSISPVIAGMSTVLVFGTHGLLGPLLEAHGIQVVFAAPGIVLATVFVTFPFVARELLPSLEALGCEEEEAALVLGANGWQIFARVTLPNIKWSLAYGVILCSARAVGEFGAVSVVSGHIRGVTNTVPLYVEVLYDEYEFAASFAMASLLLVIGLFTLLAKRLVAWRTHRRERAPAERSAT